LPDSKCGSSGAEQEVLLAKDFVPEVINGLHLRKKKPVPTNIENASRHAAQYG